MMLMVNLVAGFVLAVTVFVWLDIVINNVRGYEHMSAVTKMVFELLEKFR